MDRHRLKLGWTRVQVRNTRPGEWVHTEDGQCQIWRHVHHSADCMQLIYVDGSTSPHVHPRTYITVNYPRPRRQTT